LALYVRLEAKPGREQAVADFLKGALPLVQQESATLTWYALRLDPRVFAIFDTFPDEEGREALHETAANVGRAFRYAERPNRFLHGSDWPLVPMAPYRDFIRSAIPETHHEQVFEENARRLFQL